MLHSWKVIPASCGLAVVHLRLPFPDSTAQPVLYWYDGSDIWHGVPQPQSCEAAFKEAFVAPTFGKHFYEISTDELRGRLLSWWCKDKPHERRSIPLARLDIKEEQHMTQLFHLHIPKLCISDSAPSVQSLVPSDATAMLKDLQCGPGKQEEILEGCCKLIQTRARALTMLQQEHGLSIAHTTADNIQETDSEQTDDSEEIASDQQSPQPDTRSPSNEILSPHRGGKPSPVSVQPLENKPLWPEDSNLTQQPAPTYSGTGRVEPASDPSAVSRFKKGPKRQKVGSAQAISTVSHTGSESAQPSLRSQAVHGQPSCSAEELGKVNFNDSNGTRDAAASARPGHRATQVYKTPSTDALPIEAAVSCATPVYSIEHMTQFRTGQSIKRQDMSAKDATTAKHGRRRARQTVQDPAFE
eukprot:jgi/Ulvmu1/10535/UM064_0073.1